MLRFITKTKFGRDEDGAILVFFALSLAVLFGMMAMSFDIGRVAATQSEIQSYADHVALAAARELDKESDALTRARSAAMAMVKDKQTFGAANNTLGDQNADVKLTFLSGYPANDLDSIAGFITTTPSAATLVRAEVTLTGGNSVITAFADVLSSLIGSSNKLGSVYADATAGTVDYACAITPLMFCLPENANGTLKGFDPDAAPTPGGDGYKGVAVHLKAGGNGAAWGPGNFGFLDPAASVDPAAVTASCGNAQGANLYSCLIASLKPLESCFIENGVTTEPGQKAGLAAAIFNTRFDMFESQSSSYRTDSNYRPGPHVVSGYQAGNNGCHQNNPSITTDTMAFPPDDCFDITTGLCNGGRFGNADWDTAHAAYVSKNYGTAALPTGDPNLVPGTFETYVQGTTTRYEFYKAEIAKAYTGNADPLLDKNWLASPTPTAILSHRSTVNGGSGDDGLMACHQDSNTNGNGLGPVYGRVGVKRRVFTVAGVHCSGEGIKGKATEVEVEHFVEVFLMSPVNAGAVDNDGDGIPDVDAEGKEIKDFDLWVEIIGSAEEDGKGDGASVLPVTVLLD